MPAKNQKQHIIFIISPPTMAERPTPHSLVVSTLVVLASLPPECLEDCSVVAVNDAPPAADGTGSKSSSSSGKSRRNGGRAGRGIGLEWASDATATAGSARSGSGSGE